MENSPLPPTFVHNLLQINSGTSFKWSRGKVVIDATTNSHFTVLMRVCTLSFIGVWGLGFGVWGLGFGVWGEFSISEAVGDRLRESCSRTQIWNGEEIRYEV